MIVSLSSVRGAPGVSSWSLLLAAAWPPDHVVERVVVEADTAGGVAAARYGVGSTPGVAQFISSLRGGAEVPAELNSFARSLGRDGWLIPGPETSESSSAIWSAPGSAANVAAALGRDERVWVLDVGRADPDTPLAPVLRASAAVVVVSLGDHASVVQLPSRVRALRADGCSLVVIGISGSASFRADEIADFCEAPVVQLPADAQLPEVAGAVWTSTRARRRTVWRRSVAAADLLAGLVAGASTTTPSPEATVAG